MSRNPSDAYPERFFDEWKLGDTFVTGDHTLTREECLDFARRYDPQSFHLDDAAAQASIFGGLEASGWLTAAITMRLIAGILGIARSGADHGHARQ
jgi:acyl dehydratase